MFILCSFNSKNNANVPQINDKCSMQKLVWIHYAHFINNFQPEKAGNVYFESVFIWQAEPYEYVRYFLLTLCVSVKHSKHDNCYERNVKTNKYTRKGYIGISICLRVPYLGHMPANKANNRSYLETEKTIMKMSFCAKREEMYKLYSKNICKVYFNQNRNGLCYCYHVVLYQNTSRYYMNTDGLYLNLNNLRLYL